jgi:hypothetical protein
LLHRYLILEGFLDLVKFFEFLTHPQLFVGFSLKGLCLESANGSVKLFNLGQSLSQIVILLLE